MSSANGYAHPVVRKADAVRHDVMTIFVVESRDYGTARVECTGDHVPFAIEFVALAMSRDVPEMFPIHAPALAYDYISITEKV